MTSSAPALTIGIEEEYLLVDRASRDLCADPPPSFMAECERRLTGQVSPEFLKAQVEVGTRVCRSIAEARADLAALRRTVIDVAASHGLAPIAAATHPFANWHQQKHTDKERYNVLARDMQALAHRLLICGLHVHIGVDDDDLRIDLMSQASYFLPHLLALSTSSPFWEGYDTGLMSYRLSVFDGLPRTGIPERFDSFGEYDRFVGQMVSAGLIEDASKLWWDLRPSARFPTLEMRICDMCTRLDDAVTIAAIYACFISMLRRLRKANQRWRVYPRPLVHENRWLAQRYGADGSLVDFGRGMRVPFGELVEEIVDLVREDAERLDCVAEVERAREIVSRGTSAHRQLSIYREALAAGASHREALNGVVDWLIAETAQAC